MRLQTEGNNTRSSQRTRIIKKPVPLNRSNSVWHSSLWLCTRIQWHSAITLSTLSLSCPSLYRNHRKRTTSASTLMITTDRDLVTSQSGTHDWHGSKLCCSICTMLYSLYISSECKAITTNHKLIFARCGLRVETSRYELCWSVHASWSVLIMIRPRAGSEDRSFWRYKPCQVHAIRQLSPDSRLESWYIETDAAHAGALFSSCW